MFDTLPALVFTTHAPTSADHPGVFDNEDVVVAAVTRRSLARLDQSWQVSGCYLLLHIPEADHTTPIYVGLASQLPNRLLNQLTRSPDVLRALSIRSAARPFDEAQAAHLERALYDRLSDLRYVRLVNSRRPNGSPNVSDYHRMRIEGLVIPSIMSLLRLNGVDPDEPRTTYRPLNRIDTTHLTSGSPTGVILDEPTANDDDLAAAPDDVLFPDLTPLPDDDAPAAAPVVTAVADGPVASADMPAKVNRFSRSLQMTPRDLTFLSLIGSAQAVTYQDLSAATGASYDALRQRFPKLKNAGLVRTQGHAVTGEHRWSLTDEGHRVLRELRGDPDAPTT